MAVSPARWKSVAAMACMSLVIAVAAGCGTQQPAVTAAPVPTPTPTSAAQLQLPLDAYMLGDTQAAAAEYVSFLLRKACMAKLGFDFMPALSSGYVANGARIIQEFDSRLWGVSNLVQARLYGYHLPPWTQGASTGPQPLGTLPAAEQVALIGRAVGPGSGAATAGRAASVPAGGCVGQARREAASAGLGTVEGRTAPLVSQLQLESFDRTQSDPRVLAVFAKWSACMRAAGYAYSTPFKPAFSMSAAPTRAEIQTAVTDVTCKMKTNLLGVTYAVQSDYENDLIDKDAQQLAQIKTEIRQQASALVTLERKYGLLGNAG